MNEEKGLDGDTLALLALADTTYSVAEMGRTESAQEIESRQGAESISDTGILRGLRSTSVPKLDDLRRLSEKIRKERQVKQSGAK